jgi:DNA mismatch repair protein MSH5
VLEQANPDVILTSFKSEDTFIDVLREHGKRKYLKHLIRRDSSRIYAADSQDRLFIIRPQKDFSSEKGYSKLISLRLLSELPISGPNGNSRQSQSVSESPTSNVYDFMKRQRNETSDPFLARWNASIRIDNFASLNNSPLCVTHSRL